MLVYDGHLLLTENTLKTLYPTRSTRVKQFLQWLIPQPSICPCPLILAVMAQQVNLIPTLLAQGADIARTWRHQTALSSVLTEIHFQVQLQLQFQLQQLQLQTQPGRVTDTCSTTGTTTAAPTPTETTTTPTPSMNPLIRSLLDTCDLLLRAKANPNPTHECFVVRASECRDENVSLEVIQMLVHAKADVNKTARQDDKTALHVAAELHHPYVVALLLQSNADPHILCRRDNSSVLHAALWSIRSVNKVIVVSDRAKQTLRLLLRQSPWPWGDMSEPWQQELLCDLFSDELYHPLKLALIDMPIRAFFSLFADYSALAWCDK